MSQQGIVLRPVRIRPLWPGTPVQTAFELMHRIASRLPRSCAKRNLCAATHTCQDLLEGFASVPVTADCAVSRILPRGRRRHTRLARVERGIEIVQVRMSHIDMRKKNLFSASSERVDARFVPRSLEHTGCHVMLSERATISVHDFLVSLLRRPSGVEAPLTVCRPRKDNKFQDP